MKCKKLLLPGIILLCAVLAMAACGVLLNIAKKPVITEEEFPFSITYAYQGQTVTLEDVCTARFDGPCGYADTLGRYYTGIFESNGDENRCYVIAQKDGQDQLVLDTHIFPDYLMGDPMYDTYYEDHPYAPSLLYYDADGVEHTDAETLKAQGIELVSWEYPEPVKNEFRFSHISYLSSTTALPLILIALAALLACLIFVRKEKELRYHTWDMVGMVANIVICVTVLPFGIVVACLIDISGGSPELGHQLFYYVPMVCALASAAALSLRRKGMRVWGVILPFAGPAFFVLCLALAAAQEFVLH